MTSIKSYRATAGILLLLGISAAFGQPDHEQSPAGLGLRRTGAVPIGGRFSSASNEGPFRSRLNSHIPMHTLPFPGVQQRVPQDYPTIQGAINVSSNGDTVLVSEGTYKENIRYHGKAITVASLYLIDGDTTHIAKTIIDGSGSSQPDSGSAVYFINGEDTSSVLCGFTIQGGTGTRWWSGGYGFWYRQGGGIFCDSAGCRLRKNIVTRNRIVSAVSIGGGLCAFGRSGFSPKVILEANRFSGNYAESDTNSSWWAYGGGVALVGTEPQFFENEFDRDTAKGIVGASGGGVYFGSYSNVAPWLDGELVGNIFTSNIVQANQQGAIAAGLIVLYTGNVTIQGNLFEWNTATSTGAAGWAEGAGMVVDDETITGYGRKLILNNSFVDNTILCYAENDGGGLLVYRTLASVIGNQFTHNVAVTPTAGGAGVSIFNSSFRLENNIITRNSAGSGGGGVRIQGVPQSGTEQVMVNNTTIGNYAGSYGGGMTVYSTSTLVSINNIFWNDTSALSPEIYTSAATPTVEYSDVKGGYSGTGNINADPRFVVSDTLYHLTTNSPCIGHGIDSLQSGGVWYYAPTTDFDGKPRPMPVGTHPDLGAQEDQNTVTGVAEDQSFLPARFVLMQNYPNPCNPSTIIEYALPYRSDVNISAFNALGQLVSILVNDTEEAGYHRARFDGTGLASGVYFYRITTEGFRQTKRLILIH